MRRRFMRVTGEQRYDGFCAAQNLIRIDAFAGIALKVLHLAMRTGCEPFLELGRMIRRRSGGETAIVKAKFPRALLNGVFHGLSLCASRN